MMKLKVKGCLCRLTRINLSRMVLVGLMLVFQACVNESDTREYRNANRETLLNDLDITLNKASKSLGEYMKTGTSGLSSEKTLVFEGMGSRKKIQSILEPVVDKCVSLLKTYGISDSFLEQEFGDRADPRLVLIGIWMAEVERRGLPAQHAYHAQLADFGFLMQDDTLTEVKADWMECMLVAVGVDAIIEFVKGNVTEAIAKKAIRKIASRTLGWVGVALALYEYGNCMEWY